MVERAGHRKSAGLSTPHRPQILSWKAMLALCAYCIHSRSANAAPHLHVTPPLQLSPLDSGIGITSAGTNQQSHRRAYASPNISPL